MHEATTVYPTKEYAWFMPTIVKNATHYALWYYIDDFARGVAVSSSPVGPFTIVYDSPLFLAAPVSGFFALSHTQPKKKKKKSIFRITSPRAAHTVLCISNDMPNSPNHLCFFLSFAFLSFCAGMTASRTCSLAQTFSFGLVLTGAPT